MGLGTLPPAQHITFVYLHWMRGLLLSSFLYMYLTMKKSFFFAESRAFSFLKRYVLRYFTNVYTFMFVGVIVYITFTYKIFLLKN